MQTASEEHFTRSDVWNSRILRHDGTDGIKADARGPTAQLEMKCKNPKSPTAVAKGFSSAKVYQLSRWEKKDVLHVIGHGPALLVEAGDDLPSAGRLYHHLVVFYSMCFSVV